MLKKLDTGCNRKSTSRLDGANTSSHNDAELLNQSEQPTPRQTRSAIVRARRTQSHQPNKEQESTLNYSTEAADMSCPSDSAVQNEYQSSRNNRHG
ncbi:hypothetical protein V6Z12_A10G146000 [Gossypium hirsutum]